ncbi:bifunctional DNA-formamidopyrimidine glycosylase/DNA-(apurinic or apyrimidinic site) lyase [Caldilinea sp.]|uniref:bifunctional DNA-formamidopyrimidine glycosylase/DNA-(apurinic or apyrimidinic site) lyase n=1 Tax=Caldilinea sp. TaxID=2293560 RepID=UPI002D0A0E4E|nr:bifunctional DNA-formamidopyrimidine glycosylase/DNA-(apurinic or apyrimidinic site) lyase [Anaerolineales bacterium]HQY91860.1 bifunctional DNA-formamidopyrimidine glycosylase/DNA-(apurinic or apyrimidinic site) lyase [Caldilinea sp.]HRA64448.1 bifunctional DNA-formamidopyrimidine glycosylase/DNA-(apurinic or apyrimidinic site) lyase [Caldilinea sp.]
MPELPEVETYVRDLTPLLRGRQVLGATVTWPRTIALPDAASFIDQVAGQRFTHFGRRGKYMLLGLESGMTLIVHLRMTGHLLVVVGDAQMAQHTHVTMELDDGRRLIFQDARKFGRLWLVTDPAPILAHLGPEPFDPAFTSEHFGARLQNRTASIKALLLDQSIVAGVGNIYADEALFHARIHPMRAAGGLNASEVATLHNAIRQVLTAGIAKAGSSLGGSSLQNYSRPGGAPGGFQEEFQVFRRTGQPCRQCGAPVARIVVAQRGTHFCPHCQQLV